MSNKQAILFAGQGAQSVGMGRDLARADQECNALFSKANDILGYDLAGLCFNGPESELIKSSHCQPAIFVTGIVCYQALLKRCAEAGVKDLPAPHSVGQAGPVSLAFGTAGLSLGEWSALYMAGAVSFEDALRVLQARGRFMQEACEERDGAMLGVIGLAAGLLKIVAEKAGVEIANLNSPEQTVLSGDRKCIREAEKLAVQAGAKRTVVLNVAGAYHSSLMATAAERLEHVVRGVEFRAPRLPVVSNVTGRPHGAPEDIGRNMVLQVTSPVQWVSSIQWFQEQGVTRYIECGPGRVLSGLVKRIHPQASLCNVQDIPSLEKTLTELAG